MPPGVAPLSVPMPWAQAHLHASYRSAAHGSRSSVWAHSNAGYAYLPFNSAKRSLVCHVSHVIKSRIDCVVGSQQPMTAAHKYTTIGKFCEMWAIMFILPTCCIVSRTNNGCHPRYLHMFHIHRDGHKNCEWSVTAGYFVWVLLLQ